MDTLAAWAQGLARTLLADALPRRWAHVQGVAARARHPPPGRRAGARAAPRRRWAHVQGVAARARSLAPAVGADAGLLEAAAWLHDIGYLPDLAGTGLHGLDGARYLRDIEHAGSLLCRLVAHHSCAVLEAEERGLADAMTREFPPPPQHLADALTFSDMTTSPDGERSEERRVGKEYRF